jgi:Acetyltransferase (GNAT) domain
MWTPDADALTLLDLKGGPFSTKAFREAMIATVPGWRDVSFGARNADGTLAAVALLGRARGAESMPPEGYGGVVASRHVNTDDTLAFLQLASRTLRLPSLRVRSLELDGTVGAGKRFATASVVWIDEAAPPAAHYARLARRSLKRATDAGATVVASDTFEAFWPVYAAAAQRWAMRYPESLVHQLVDKAIARVHSVRLGDGVVAALLTLVSPSHWMCWLAGQSEKGRSIAASYLAYDAVLAEAQAAGITVVNLGASVGGGVEFKRHLGASDAWMREWRHETVPAAAVRITHTSISSLSRAVRMRLR